MAKTLTFSEAQVRFGDLVTNGISIDDAIQEAVDRIYEMGRYPGTTVEVALAEEDFVEDTDLNEFYVYFTESTYAGAIGFRDSCRGWAIVDHTALYKDGVNAGDREFIDLGTVTVSAVLKRKYRCPHGWVADGGPYYALMKLEAPTLEEDTVIPVQSAGALKCAIQAVCFEYVGDEEKAMLKWQQFDGFMKLSERQVHGPKRFILGMDSSLKRSPRQFH